MNPEQQPAVSEDESPDRIDTRLATGAKFKPIFGDQEKSTQAATLKAMAEAAAVSDSGSVEAASLAHQRGTFGPVFTWPGVPIHQVLLPDGRVMSFGTDPTGKVDAKLHYGLRTLSAASETAYGSSQGSWNYPRAWAAPNGEIFGITPRGGMYSLDPAAKRVAELHDQDGPRHHQHGQRDVCAGQDTFAA